MKNIPLSDFKEKLNAPAQSFFLIDTREVEEYEVGHIPGALLMPWHSIEERVRGIKPHKEFILYCNTGVRAQKAARSLEGNGFSNVLVYSGGWEEWEEIEQNLNDLKD